MLRRSGRGKFKGVANRTALPGTPPPGHLTALCTIGAWRGRRNGTQPVGADAESDHSLGAAILHQPRPRRTGGDVPTYQAVREPWLSHLESPPPTDAHIDEHCQGQRRRDCASRAA